MKRKFNIKGTCVPHKHYMVDISEKLKEIKKLVDNEDYFTINQGRQYGKTTTLSRLRRFLADEYTIISMSFQGLGDASFENEAIFCQEFLENIKKSLRFSNATKEYQERWQNEDVTSFKLLSNHITDLCMDQKVVLMIDEVDQASNHRVFLNFLGMLREKFLARADEMDFTFHSVILAGVYDIKNIKIKMVQEGLRTLATSERQHNSPWNIAAKFDVDMSFSPTEITGMLVDYESEHQTNMNLSEVAEEIHFFTKGYPVLVSNICQYINEELEKNWTVEGIREAVRLLVREKDNELFKSLFGNLEGNDEVYRLMYDVLILGARRSFSIGNSAIDLAYRYDYIQDVNERVKISNKIFEIVMTNYFISKDEQHTGIMTSNALISEITRGGRFNMQLCLERFLVYWQELYSEKEAKFLEKQCRMLFLIYLKPLLNGGGFSFIETASTDNRRMDLIVTYGKERFVLELKTWKGKAYNDKGVNQLLGYMEKLNEEKGYLLTFDFRKKPEEFKPKWENHGERQIFEARVYETIQKT